MRKNLFIGSAAIGLLLAMPAPAFAQEEDAAPAEEATLGLNHIGFTVSDLEASAAFFTETLGWQEFGGDPDYPAIFVGNAEMFVTLWQASDPETANAFDRKNNVGLHHMAITMRDLTALHDLHEKLKAHPQVTIEFAPEFLGDGPTTHMMIREPSGLRLEFIVPRSRISEEEQALPNPRVSE